MYKYIFLIALSFVTTLFAREFTLVNNTDRPASVKLKTVNRNGKKNFYYKGASGKFVLYSLDHPDRYMHSFHPGKLMPEATWKVQLNSEGESVLTIHIDYDTTLAGGCFEITRDNTKRMMREIYGENWKTIGKDFYKHKYLGHLKTLNIRITSAYLRYTPEDFSRQLFLRYLVKRKDIIGDDRFLFEIITS